jgi:hypothetical protein
MSVDECIGCKEFTLTMVSYKVRTPVINYEFYESINLLFVTTKITDEG